MLGYWAPVAGNEMRSEDKNNTHWGGKNNNNKFKLKNWGSIFFSLNLVLRRRFHPQFWDLPYLLHCTFTAAHFLHYLTIMPCQKTRSCKSSQLI
jgi:hypothetical protein